MINVAILVPIYNLGRRHSDFKVNLELYLKSFGHCNFYIVDDGSQDDSFERLRIQFENNRRVILIKRAANGNFGKAVNEALRVVKEEFVMIYADDFPLELSCFEKLLMRARGDVVVTTVHVNSREVRHPLRRIFSVAFTAWVNIVFAKRVQYYNGVGLYPVRILRGGNAVASSSFFWRAEALLVAMKESVEIDFFACNLRRESEDLSFLEGSKRALRLRNIGGVLRDALRTWLNLR